MPVIKNDVAIPRLIILRGSPAVGKSTIGKKIASFSSNKLKAYIPIDDFQLYDKRTMSKDRERFAIINASLIAKNFLLYGFDVIVDYVFDEINDIETFMELILNEKLGKIDTFYVQKFYLDAPIEKIIKRNQSRSNKRGEYMNLPLLRKLYAKVSETKGMINHEIVVDSTKYTSDQCARYILSYNRACRNDSECIDIVLPEKDIAKSLNIKQ